MTAGDIRPNARGGRAARRANLREREQERLEARSVISNRQDRGEIAQAEAIHCPICNQAIHPTNWSAHMTMKHPDETKPLHEAEPGWMPLTAIRVDGGTQPRAQTEENVIQEYADAMREGVQFPKVIVFYDGAAYWLADGFHRVEAAKRVGHTDIAAEVRQGTQRDAILFSVGANADHGLRRTNFDKQRAVQRLLSDDEWANWSNREIARRCAVSESLVRSLREKRSDDDAIRTYTTKHGTTATMQTGNIGKQHPKPNTHDPYMHRIYHAWRGGFTEGDLIFVTQDGKEYYAFDKDDSILRSLKMFPNLRAGGIGLSGSADYMLVTRIDAALLEAVEQKHGSVLAYAYNDVGEDMQYVAGVAFRSHSIPLNTLPTEQTPPIRYGQIEDDYQPDVPSVQVEATPPIQEPPSNPIEASLGGRGAKVRARSGQEGTLAFVQGRNAHVDTANGRRVYDALYLRKVEDSTLPSGAAYVIEDSNYKRDSRTTRPATPDESQPYDRMQTPPYALDPLLQYLGWSLPSTIWEPACGEGLIIEALFDAGWTEEHVIASDILTGQSFFDYEPDKWEVIVTNPPYSLKIEWIERCYALGKPFALLLPVEALGLTTVYPLLQQHGFEIMLLDNRVDFKMPNKGWNSSAQFATFWLCHDLLPEKVMFGSIKAAKKAFKAEIGDVTDDDPE